MLQAQRSRKRPDGQQDALQGKRALELANVRNEDQPVFERAGSAEGPKRNKNNDKGRPSLVERMGAAFNERSMRSMGSDWLLVDENRSIHLTPRLHSEYDKVPSIFASNRVRTSKYTWLTFVPVNLYNQYQKAANVYFTFISCLQTIKLISITDGQPLMLVPLSFVLLISMVKDAWEDYKRKKADRFENRQPARVFKADDGRTKIKNVEWADVAVGQIIELRDGEFTPADVVLLHAKGSSGQTPTVFIETKDLDGETNLKMKQVPRSINERFTGLEDFQDLTGTLTCEPPNEHLYKFEGRMELIEMGSPRNGYQGRAPETIPLTPDNVVLRGCKLRNTEVIYGLVIYTGHETKVMKNSVNAKYKFSKLEKATNFTILVILCFQCLLASTGGLIGTLWIDQNGRRRTDRTDCVHFKGYWCSSAYYILDYELMYLDLILEYIKMTGTWILIFTNFIPISMMTTLEMVKLGQSYFMQQDMNMLDQEAFEKMRPQASNLNEELGQIEYVFSDKTGTLTCNVMEFKKFSAGTESYGTGQRVPPEGQEENVNFSDPGMLQILRNESAEEHAALRRVILFLATCHTIIIDQKKGKYNSASPDELALVNAAKQFGYQFVEKDSDDNIIILDKRKNQRLTYKLLNVCEFTSTRKRMSCIYRDPQGRLVLLCKGADNVVAERLSERSRQSAVFRNTQRSCDRCAKEGLRTLFLAERYLDEETYARWSREQFQAQLEVQDREGKVAAVDEKIEVDMELIGSTAIEDRLQDDVAGTIEFMKCAGIKVWVLTGDKVETAMNIGVSAGLLDQTMEQHLLDEHLEKGSLLQYLSALKMQTQHKNQDDPHGIKHAIILSGACLSSINANERYLDAFLECSDNVDVVLACRVSPKQKADIVMMIKERFPDKCTLGIGDGANDVNMILKAHVGVGILGKEGQQAARTADFAIAQFKFLRPLLFVHGREAYRRNSLLILYNFYKNIAYGACPFAFGLYSAFSGQIIYEKLIYLMFNITMTALPIVWFALFDNEHPRQDPKAPEQFWYVGGDESGARPVENGGRDGKQLGNEPSDQQDKYLMTNPALYKIGMQELCFSLKLYTGWIVYSLWHALVVFYSVYFALTEVGVVMPDGKETGLWLAGTSAYGGCVFVVNATLLLKFHIHDAFGILLFIGSVASFFLVFLLLSLFARDDIRDLFAVTVQLPTVWLALGFAVGQVFVFELLYSSCRRLGTSEQRPLLRHVDDE